jgi:hypothetical protein
MTSFMIINPRQADSIRGEKGGSVISSPSSDSMNSGVSMFTVLDTGTL